MQENADVRKPEMPITICLREQHAAVSPHHEHDDHHQAMDHVPSHLFIVRLLEANVLLRDEWEILSEDVQNDIFAIRDQKTVLAALIGHHLLTAFQAEKIQKGLEHQILVGHYRLLDLIGRGGMGEVYRAEHIYLRNRVAVKLFAEDATENPDLLDRFFFEARAIARLKHPNLICCTDAGRASGNRYKGNYRHYYVMELVPGQDLDKVVEQDGPFSVDRAARVFKQIADALTEAHRFGLIHRDVKPSNIMLTHNGQAKLLDFGLVHHASRQVTSPGIILGTVDYMAPEQATDPANVDGRADVFSLGATLFACLTGRVPFAHSGNVFATLSNRLTAPPPRLRDHRPDLPAGLDSLVAKMMDPNRDQRVPSAAAVANALLPYTSSNSHSSSQQPIHSPRETRVLVVDDDPDIRMLVRALLEPEFIVSEAEDGLDGLDALDKEPADLVIVDQEMPRLDGGAFMSRLTQNPTRQRPMILYMSGTLPVECLGGLLLAGADDFIQKPFTENEFLSRVRGLLKRRLPERAPPRKSVHYTIAADSVRLPIRNAGISMLGQGACLLMEELGCLSPGYHERLPRYLRILAPAIGKEVGYEAFAEASYMTLLEDAALTHDIGMLGLRSAVALKPGTLVEEESLVVQTHVTIGEQVLNALADARPEEHYELALAAEIARHHHERWDGKGYPDELRGEAIPPAARVVALISVYDALRSRRAFRAGYSHPRAMRRLTTESDGWFDPVLIRAFTSLAEQFDGVFQSPAH